VGTILKDESGRLEKSEVAPSITCARGSELGSRERGGKGQGPAAKKRRVGTTERHIETTKFNKKKEMTLLGSARIGYLHEIWFYDSRMYKGERSGERKRRERA